MKKIAIFDLDGTLVNSIYDLAGSVNIALRNASLPENELEDYYYFVGNGMEHLVRSAMREKGSDDELYRIIRADFDRQYAIHCNDKTCAYEGLSELLQRLHTAGIKTAILSNKAESFIKGIVEKNFPENNFLAAWGQREGVERKPSGDGVKKLLKELRYRESECVYIGDSDVDVLTARNAGVDIIGVLWGFRTREELEKAGADRIAATPQELYDHIVSI